MAKTTVERRERIRRNLMEQWGTRSATKDDILALLDDLESAERELAEMKQRAEVAEEALRVGADNYGEPGDVEGEWRAEARARLAAREKEQLESEAQNG